MHVHALTYTNRLWGEGYCLCMNLCRHFLLGMLPSLEKHVMEGSCSSPVLACSSLFCEPCPQAEVCGFWRLHRSSGIHRNRRPVPTIPSLLCYPSMPYVALHCLRKRWEHCVLIYMPITGQNKNWLIKSYLACDMTIAFVDVQSGL